MLLGLPLKALGYSAGQTASFTMSIQPVRLRGQPKLMSGMIASFTRDPGGARRDRTDDLKLAKLALSQLSYGPLGSESSGRPGQI